MKKNHTLTKRICIVLGGVLIAAALVVAGLYLHSFYMDQRYPANILPPFLMLKGKLYQESSDLVGILSPAEQERYGFENIGTIQKKCRIISRQRRTL